MWELTRHAQFDSDLCLVHAIYTAQQQRQGPEPDTVDYSYTPDNPLGDVLAFTLGRGRALQGSVEYQF